MRKILCIISVALLALTACTSSDDNPATSDLGVKEKIIGKWIMTDKNGQPIPTSERLVYTFVSTTKALVSASLNSRPEVGSHWSGQLEADVAISGNNVTVSMNLDEHTTSVHNYTITAIDANEFTASDIVTITIDGNVIHTAENVFRFTKVTADYRETVLGLWECTGLSGGETFNDANARLEFLADGTYRYYRMDDNNDWQTVTTREFQDYFVDGTLLATRWKNQGEDELREWWEIKSLNGDEMVWTALRQNADGSTFQQEVKWKKIDLNIPEKIIGKWVPADKDGQPMISNKKMVITFTSSTKAYMSASLNPRPEMNPEWMDNIEANVTINGNLMTLTLHANEHKTMVHEFIVTDINATEFTANHKVTVTVDGNVMFVDEDVIRLTKVTADYRTAIVGTWEGRCTSEGSVFDDGQEHRWQYKADGTYVYYVKDGDNWVPSENTLNEYFVDGTLLCMRWIDNEQDNREWWEITISGDKMNWTALRQKEDGTTFTATFEMTKVQ